MKQRNNIAIALVCFTIILILVFCLWLADSAYGVNQIDVSADMQEQAEIQTAAHDMAQAARTLGYGDDSDIIQTAQAHYRAAADKIQGLNILATYTDGDVDRIARVMYAEARGSSEMEASAVGWCILNRVDSPDYPNSIAAVATKGQFAYSPFTDSITYHDLAYDVLLRYCMEQAGADNVGRALPSDYLHFRGDGQHNHFYMTHADAQAGINEWNWEEIK